MPTPTVLLVAYGSAVVVSGCLRFALQEGGTTGLLFGLVMGGLIFAAAGFCACGRTRFGGVVAALGITTVGGWFAYESLVIKGFEQAEVRQLIIVAMSGATALWLWVLSRSGSGRDAAASKP